MEQQVRMKLHKGNCVPVARKSPHSLYRYELATYDEADRYDQGLAKGFIEVWGMSAQIAAAAQRNKKKG